MNLGNNLKLDKIEYAALPGERWRSAGRNARLGVHGKNWKVDIVRLTAGDTWGFGMAHVSPERAESLVGTPLPEMFTSEGRVKPQYADIELPLLDWLGRVNECPVYQIVGGENYQAPEDGFKVPLYDTSLYFDDLHLDDEKAAVELMQAEIMEGWERGHRAFKAKIGRGARYMPLQAGMQRDIAVVKGMRQVIGPSARLMLDANNGYNLNLTKDFLAATREDNIYWLEEPFYEDGELLTDLKKWLDAQNLPVLVADGEGDASPHLIRWAKAGLVDIIQYDMRGYGFGNWLDLGKELDKVGVKSGPHNYGVLYGNYASAHLASGIQHFAFIEWDGGQADGLDASAYRIEEGLLVVPEKPGFGLELDDSYFTRRVKEVGFSASK